MEESNAKPSAARTADREIVFTRFFDAPRALVFAAWTDPNHVAQWWGPNGFTTTIHAMDVRPGGVWRFVMHGPDGVDYDNKNTFIEVVKPERLVFHHGDEGQPGYFRMIVSFAEEQGKTKLTMRLLFASPAEREAVVTKYHAIEGGNQTLDRLAGYLPGMKNAAAESEARELVFIRVLDAPREVMWRAWTDPAHPAHLAQWWGPKGFTNPVCELDLRPGGALRIVMRAPDSVEYPMRGVFREIVAPERLVFNNMAVDAADKPLLDGLTIVTLIEYGGKTRLTVQTRAVALVAHAVPFLEGMEAGWTQSLERLVAAVAQTNGRVP